MRNLIFTTLFVALFSSAFAANKTQIAVRIESSNGKTDEATVYFDLGIDPTYDVQEDAQKVFTGNPGVPVLYTVTSDMIECQLNGFGTFSATEVVALGYDVDITGTYTFSVSMLDNVPATSIVRLEDRQTGTWTDIRSLTYSVQLNDTDPATGRFFLHIALPAQVTTTNAGCANNDGLIHISQDNTAQWDAVKLLDVFGSQVGTYNNITGQFDFNSLADGDYYVVYILGNYSATEEYHVNSNYVTADIQVSNVSVNVGEPISFSAMVNENHVNQYNWDFGDGTLITGVANPTISYYEAGTYTVTLLASNDLGCSDMAQKTITVNTVLGVEDELANEVNVFSINNTITVNMNGIEVRDAQLEVYNLIGQSVYSRSINSQREIVTLNESNGYYLVSVKNAGDQLTKRVFIGN